VFRRTSVRTYTFVFQRQILIHQEMQIFGHFEQEIVKTFNIFRCSCRTRGRPLFPSLRLWQVSSRTNVRKTKRFHTCSLTRAGKLPQRPAQRRITSQALQFNLACSKQIQTVWSFVKRSIFIKNTPRFFGTLEFHCPATLNI
jgi:hypothetical protein